jgi:hypothetical protein
MPRGAFADGTAGASSTMREDRDASQIPQLETANEHGKPRRPASKDPQTGSCNLHTYLTLNVFVYSNTHMYLNVDVNLNSFRC